MCKRFTLAVSALGLIATLATFTSASAATPTSLSGLTGAQIDALTLAQMRAQGSYTVVVVSSAPGLNATSVTSSTQTSGIRHDDINGQHGERRFVNGVVYVHFTTALEKIYFGKVVTALTNQWVSFTRGQAYYNVFSTTMTGTTLGPLLRLPGKLNVSAPLTFDARSVVALTANSASTSTSGIVETLYVADKAPFLPVALVLKSRSSGSTKLLETITFTNWGTHVSVTAPLHFTSSSKFKLP